MGQAAHPLALVALSARGDTAVARERAAAVLESPELPDARRAIILASVAFAHYLDCNFVAARVESERALDLARIAGDNEALLHSLSMSMLASAGEVWGADDPVEDYFALAWRLRETLGRLDLESRLVALHMLGEGALATGRISEALAVHTELDGPPSRDTPGPQLDVPYPVFFLLQRARILLFAGEVHHALDVLADAMRESERLGNERLVCLSEAFRGLALAHLGDRTVVRTVVERITRSFPAPEGLLETGCWIVCAFAFQAVGERDRAAECVRVAGRDSDLSGIQLVDRALGYDILVGAALAHHDLAAASEWGARSLALAPHPAATVIVDQILAVLDEARGDTESAAHRARVAAARSRLTGRYLDAARADLLEARALASSGQSSNAARRLTAVAHEASLSGVVSVHRSASRQLRALGRRLAPRPGEGWTALGERERQVAVLAAEGFSNRVIASSLFLSERTVQTYVSRVLAAFDVESRSGLPRVIVVEEPSHPPRADLTRRQWEIAHLVGVGLTNRQIASELGISIKTVEKHTSAILQRWGLDSRTAIAHTLAHGRGAGAH